MRTLVALAAGMAVLACSGCTVFQSQEAPGATRREQEPDNRLPYWIYVPKSFAADPGKTRWPLVITCHGAGPWDSAGEQIREWRALAERGQFIVIAPELASSDSSSNTTEQFRRQVDDERLILAIVKRALRQYQLDSDRVYITGHGSGSYAALWAGLRNPKVFRAISLRTPAFDADYLNHPLLLDKLDVHQPVQILVAEKDPAVAQGQAAAAWLREHGWTAPTLAEIPLRGMPLRHPGMAWEFLAKIPAHFPLVRAVASPVANQPLARRFTFHADRPVEAVYWKLGDGFESRERDFTHAFEKPGEYECLLVARPAKGAAISRSFKVKVGL